MKLKLILLLQFLSAVLYAQTVINKEVMLKTGHSLELKFDYPELIKVSTWDRDIVSVQATVHINNGENDDAFELSIVNTDRSVIIENRIADLKNLPQVITVKAGSQRMMFKSKEEYRDYKAEHGSSFDRVSWGVDIDITIEIKVPRGANTNIVSVYGMVEVIDFEGPIKIEAQYGGVDVALNEKKVGELSAETNYGQIYSNLDVRFDGDNFREKDFYTFVSARPGAGPRYDIESKYGNVYLRKMN